MGLLVNLIGNIAEVVNILPDFLSAWSIKYWERGIEISNCNCGFVHFFVQFCQVCFIYFEAFLLRA